MISIRPALESDLESLCSFDLIARQSEERREFIGRSVANGTCYVAVADQEVIGYGVLEQLTFCSSGLYRYAVRGWRPAATRSGHHTRLA